jgi:hypothetical protein
VRERKKPFAPMPGTHPLAESAWSTFYSARTGLDEALDYYGATDGNDTARLRVALAGIVAACDAFKATANAYSNILGHVQRSPRPDGREGT